MNNKKIYDNLIELLIKKANGFYYTEEQEDYEKTQNKSNEFKNLSFFDNNDTNNTQQAFNNDTIKLTNGKKNKENTNSNLVLVKKKITTHYIPPDMLAVKILFETIREKVNDDDLTNLSDEDLLNLKNKLIGELLNEDKQNL